MKTDVSAFVVSELAKQGVSDGNPGEVLSQRLSTLGLDSLDFMELLNAVEEQFAIRIDDDTVSAGTTVADFIAFIEQRVAAREAPRAAAGT